MKMRIPPEVLEEEQLLETVQANLVRLLARASAKEVDHDRALTELRDSLDGEKLAEDIASIVESMERMAALRAQQQRAPEGRIDPDNPYFGHLVVEDDHGKRSILIGRETFLSDRVRIVDWRNAPVSRIFYQYSEGDEYDEDFADRQVSGQVLVRRTLAIADGAVRRVGTHERTWVRDGDSGWVDLRHREASLTGGAGRALRASSLGTGAANARRDRHLPQIASLLDASQFDLITRGDSGVVVIQGSAGSGKTTVALHRIAYLRFKYRGSFRPQNILVMVFSRALSAYIGQVLPALGVDGVKVVQLELWAERLRRAHISDLPTAYADNTPAIVTRFKTHLVMLQMTEDFATLDPGGDPAFVFEEMLTDRKYIEDSAARWAPGEFSDDQLKRVHRWCTDQHFIRAEGGGPNEDDRPCLDREDDPILLRLYQLLQGPLRNQNKSRLSYDHVMIDEAQDLSPLELSVVLACAGDRQSVTLAGDDAQQIAEDRSLRDWTETIDLLTQDHIQVSPLQVSYRSTRQIMEVAHEILGPLAPDEPPYTTREGAPVGHLAFGGMGEAVAWLSAALTDLMQREPSAYVALLCAHMGDAASWYEVLERAEVPHVTLVDDQDFSFSPGIEVTDIRSSKGLEFDYVVLLGVDRDRFGADDGSRHLLHVGATRAAHQLWILSTGRPSSLIPPHLPGLIGGI